MNPWIILAVVIAIVGAGAGGWYKGTEYQKGQDAQAQLDAVKQAVADANTQAEKDKNLAVTQAQRNTAAQTRAALLRSQANASIQANHLPVVCNWDKSTYSVLVAAVADANASTAGQRKVSDAVRQSNSPSGQPSGHSEKLDVRPNQPVRRVPSTAR